MSTQHTPGPWLLREGSGNYLWEVVVERRAARTPRVICRPFGINREANARLIAAAPDMLAALREITLLSYTYPKLSWKAWLIKANEIANAAIAKAEGKP